MKPVCSQQVIDYQLLTCSYIDIPDPKGDVIEKSG